MKSLKSFLSRNRNIILLVFAIILFTACADKVSIDACMPDKTYGFWSGLLHGFITPFSFIVSLFKNDVAIYAVNNSGNWYNFGFVIGAAVIFGGGGNASKR
mgnify:CR=1 FL=1